MAMKILKPNYDIVSNIIYSRPYVNLEREQKDKVKSVIGKSMGATVKPIRVTHKTKRINLDKYR